MLFTWIFSFLFCLQFNSFIYGTVINCISWRISQNKHKFAVDKRMVSNGFLDTLEAFRQMIREHSQNKSMYVKTVTLGILIILH